MSISTAPRHRPLRALSTAEYRQFRRNKTLVYTGVVIPIGLPLLTYFVGRKDSDPSPLLVATAFEMFALLAVLFVQFYSVLSMVTTRRGEGVLKRLRTGEARDWQILLAPAVPGALLTVVGAVVVAAMMYATGATAPVNPLLMVLAIALGAVIFTLLALATSAMTKNAEAAQITSMPVMVVAMLGMGSLRGLMPQRLEQIADWTPFAAVSDLTFLGAIGKLPSAPEGASALSFSQTVAEAGRPLVTLGVWAVLAWSLARKHFRWDDRE
jgi:ABC-2 type transport system permease protein